MLCSSCGKEVQEGAKFCRYCGHKADLTCSKCGKELDEGARFCRNCGSAVEGGTEDEKTVPKFISAKKQSDDWYIAATYFLTVGMTMIGISVLFSIVDIILTALFPEINVLAQNNILSLIYIIIKKILVIWLGVIYSAKYLTKTYVIKNVKNIVILATIYAVFIGGILMAGFTGLILKVTDVMDAQKFIIDSLAGYIVGNVVFYLFSKKYLKNSGDTD